MKRVASSFLAEALVSETVELVVKRCTSLHAHRSSIMDVNSSYPLSTRRWLSEDVKVHNLVNLFRLILEGACWGPLEVVSCRVIWTTAFGKGREEDSFCHGLLRRATSVKGYLRSMLAMMYTIQELVL